MPKTRLTIAATLILLAGCDKTPEQKNSIEAPVREAPATDTGNATANVTDITPAGNATSAAKPSAHAIPDAFQGRWGMVPGDCGPDASIAKGLMVVDGEKLRFYESVGKPAVVTWPAPDRMEGRFSFSGEGMEWSKDMTLTLKEKDKLVRTEKDPVASYTYMRCKG